VLSVLLRYTNSDYPIGILWALCPLLFFDIWILITSLVSFGYCVVSFSLIYRFWLPLWYLLTIVSSALLRYTDSDYPLIRISKKNWQHNGQNIPKGNQNPYIEEELTIQWPKDTKGVIRICISKKGRRNNDQKIPKR
jgi:hypothetical protein